MNRAFSIVELMIVVAVLGILAAMVIPQFQSHTTLAKESAAKNNLHILRAAMELYAAQHNDVAPGYANGNAGGLPNSMIFILQLTKFSNQSGQTSDVGTAGFPLGPYVSDMPENPFNAKLLLQIVGNSDSFPAEGTGNSGWVYKAATKEIRLDWPGTDRSGIRYYDY